MTTILRDNVPVARHHGDPAAELRALRTAVVVADLDHVGLTTLVGPAAWDLADRLLPRDLYLRESQARQTVLLDEHGAVLADVTVVHEDDTLVLITDGLPPEEVRARIVAERRPGEVVEVRALDATHVPLEVTGPWAWQLMGRFADPGILGLPYMSLARLDGGVRCLRAGRTGEYAYDLIVAREALPAVRDRLLELGGPLDARRVGCEALDHAALENWFFNAHAEGRFGLTPLHLQLQWRISRHKAFVGSEALAALRSSGLDRRLTGIRGDRALAVGQDVTLDGLVVGRVLVAAADAQGPGALGLALLDLAVAEPGLDALSAAGAPIRTVAPPFVVNQSLSIKPQRDAYAGRHLVAFAPGSWR